MKKQKLIIALPVAGIAFWTRLEAELKNLTFDVEVWSEVTEDAYRNRGTGLSAWWIRVRTLLVFPMRVLFSVIVRLDCRGGVLFVPTTPFFLPMIIGEIASFFNIRTVNLLYDLYPDVLILAKKVRPSSLLDWCFSKITSQGIRSCDATVFLGKRLKEAAEDRYGRSKRGYVIEVGADGSLFALPPMEHRGPVRVLYAGTMGYAHEIATLSAVLKDPLPPRLEIVFHANGAGYEKLKNNLNESTHFTDGRLRFERPLAEDKWVSVMSSAHVGLVTMLPGTEDVLFPSKAYSAMLAGQAILAICPLLSDLAQTVLEADCGWVVEPGDTRRLRQVFGLISTDTEAIDRKRKNSLEYGRTHFDMGVVAKKWALLASEIRNCNLDSLK